MENSIDITNKKRGLGRGLGSLLGSPADSTQTTTNDKPTTITKNPAPIQQVTTPAVLASAQLAPQPNIQQAQKMNIPDHARIWNIPIEKIIPGSHQPRKNFEKAQLDELAQSIREHGVLQPLLVRRKSDGKYELIAGERRWRASQQAGLVDIPAIIKNFEDRQSAEVALIENIQREDLNPIEEAMALQQLIKEFGLTQQELAARIGKDRATLANSLRLLSLPQSILELISQRKLSSGHAKVLLSLEDSLTQIELAQSVIEKTLSVRQLESLVKKVKSEKPNSLKDDSEDTSKAIATQLVQGLAEDLQKTLGTKVQIDYNSGKGKIAIHFYSDEELSNLIEQIK